MTIEAEANLNPDIDQLDRLELVEQGEIVKTVSFPQGASQLRLRYQQPASRGTWFILRAHGKRAKEAESVLALTAPIYIHSDGEPFWKPSAVPAIVKSLKQHIRATLDSDREEIENWDTDLPDLQHWQQQESMLRKRIEQAAAFYDDLEARATSSRK